MFEIFKLLILEFVSDFDIRYSGFKQRYFQYES